MKAEVQSFTDAAKWYRVIINGKKLKGKGKCSCPRWIFGDHVHDCKHIVAVRKGDRNFAMRVIEA